MTRLISVLLLLAVLVEASPTTPQELATEDEDNQDTPDSQEAQADDTEETLILSKAVCLDGHKSAFLDQQCCQIYMEADRNAEYCALKLHKFHTTDPKKKFILYSKLTECIYNRRGYVKNNRTLNIGHVKAAAAKRNDPLEQKYIVDMYRSCDGEAKANLAALESGSNTDTRALHSPYFLFLDMCILQYTRHHQCPYFRWGSNEDAAIAKCKSYTPKCKELLKK